MSEENVLDDVIDNIKNEDGKLPQMLNVLTILTFIGSGLGLLGGLVALVASGAIAAYLPGGGAAGGSIVVYAILSIVGAGACIYGALQMRKLSKQGFFIYIAGWVIAIIASTMLAGFNIMGLVWAAVFIGLYASQSKHLK